MKTRQYTAWALLAMLLGACGGNDGTGKLACSPGSAAGCGGDILSPSTGGTDPGEAASVSLVVSSNELSSAALPGTEASVTAIVKRSDNAALAGARIDFSTDSGTLSGASPTTDTSGKASATLGVGSSRQNRAIRITATVGGQSASAVVNVTGTRLEFNVPSFMAQGSSTEMLVSLLDSANRPLAGQPISAALRHGNGVFVGARTSDSKGQVPVRIDAAVRGSEALTVSALGTSATRTFLIGGSEVSMSPAVGIGIGGVEVLKEVPVAACSELGGSYASGTTGSVTLTASRGTLFSDAACRQALPVGALPLVNGAFPRTWIRSDKAGISNIDAVLADGVLGSTRIEFIAPLLGSARVSLKPNLPVIGSGERSTLSAVVRDGTGADNLVKGATVQFTIAADPSSGSLLAPLTAVTGSDGVAQAVFVGGPGDSGKDGTRIQARIAEVPAATAVASLTVNKKSLAIQFGTAYSLLEYSPSVLQQDFTVYVTDSGGTAVKDADIAVTAWPTRYRKGYMDWMPDSAQARTPGSWLARETAECANEDLQRNGAYDSALDINSNGSLDPVIALALTSSGKTDARGLASISLRYPRERANWTSVELNVAASVAGAASLARTTLSLRGLGKDYLDDKIEPPGAVSPYGSAALCTSSR